MDSKNKINSQRINEMLEKSDSEALNKRLTEGFKPEELQVLAGSGNFRQRKDLEYLSRLFKDTRDPDFLIKEVNTYLKRYFLGKINNKTTRQEVKETFKFLISDNSDDEFIVTLLEIMQTKVEIR